MEGDTMNQHNCQELYQRYQDTALEAMAKINSGETIASVAKYYGFAKDGWVRWLNKNGYRQNPSNRKLRNSLVILQQAYDLCVNGMSIIAAARQLNIPVRSLRKDLMQQYGFKTLPDGKKPVNDHYFSVIDSAKKAYWLGFFAADGYNDGKGSIEFCLKDSDKTAVERFAKAIGATQKISKRNVRGCINWRISIKSVQMSKDLSTAGFGHNKSFNKIFPSLPKDLYPHFIRGYLDGDGHIGIKPNGRLTSVTIVTASIDFATGLKAFLADLDIYTCIKQESRRGNIVISFRVLDSYKLLDYCYRDSTVETRLERKYDRYLQVLKCRLRSRVMKKTLDDKNGIKLEGLQT